MDFLNSKTEDKQKRINLNMYQVDKIATLGKITISSNF